MLEQLLSTLKTFQGAEYLIRETQTRRVEGYNIKKQSEMAREVETCQLALTLYAVFEEEGKKYRGSYNTEIHPGTSTDELKEIISQGMYAAGFVKNAYYPLVSPAAPKAVVGKDVDIDNAIAELQTAFHATDNHGQGHISYSEFFVTHSDVRIINSSGVDVGYTTNHVFVETAVHQPTPDGGEIEISEAYRFSLQDIPASAKYLQGRVADLFTVAQKKAVAVPTPTVGDINILLSGECLSTFFSYYQENADAQMVYQSLSTYKEGDVVQGTDDSDRITITLDPNMEGSANSKPYDQHGQPLDSHEIITKGKLVKYWGDTRFSSYLGTQPTGNISNIYVTGGTASDTDLRKEPYLELVSFSDFQVNSVTGDLGSEIRLGFYFDGKTITPVTGGSITGNMANVQDSLRMSVEERQYNNYRGPATVRLRGASISGS